MNRRSFIGGFIAALVGAKMAPSLIKEAIVDTRVLNTCEELNALFAASEMQISDRVLKKMERTTNAYWGKITHQGKFPSSQGTTIRERYVEDEEYNAALPPYDPHNEDTWPLMKKV